MATTTSPARGVCAICGGTFALTSNGQIRAHGSTDQPRRCTGSGWAPATVRAGGADSE
jgi:hypothetical protein